MNLKFNNRTMKQLNNRSSMKIVFFGTPQFVAPVLKKLEDNFDVVGQIRKPKQWNNEAIEQLASLNPDLFVVAAYGQILMT